MYLHFVKPIPYWKFMKSPSLDAIRPVDLFISNSVIPWNRPPLLDHVHFLEQSCVRMPAKLVQTFGPAGLLYSGTFNTMIKAGFFYSWPNSCGQLYKQLIQKKYLLSSVILFSNIIIIAANSIPSYTPLRILVNQTKE